MAELSHIHFKHGNLALQVWSEPQMRGTWKGVLIGLHKDANEVTRLATTLKFNAPYSFGASVWSVFKVCSREPLAIIDEVVQRMRQEVQDFSDMPDDLWFTVLQGFTVTIGQWTPKELRIRRLNPHRGQQAELVTRVRALPEVEDATELQDGTVVVAPQGVISDAKAMLDICQKLAEAYEKRQE